MSKRDAADEWLDAHDPERHALRKVERDTSFCVWGFEYYEAPADDDDSDRADIASTFAELSGGWLAPRFAAAAAAVSDCKLAIERERIRKTRAEDPVRAAEWRRRERARRYDPAVRELVLRRDKERKRAERFRLTAPRVRKRGTKPVRGCVRRARRVQQEWAWRELFEGAEG